MCVQVITSLLWASELCSVCHRAPPASTPIHLTYSQDEGFRASRNEIGVGGTGNEAMDCAWHQELLVIVLVVSRTAIQLLPLIWSVLIRFRVGRTFFLRCFTNKLFPTVVLCKFTWHYRGEGYDCTMWAYLISTGAQNGAHNVPMGGVYCIGSLLAVERISPAQEHWCYKLNGCLIADKMKRHNIVGRWASTALDYDQSCSLNYQSWISLAHVAIYDSLGGPVITVCKLGPCVFVKIVMYIPQLCMKVGYHHWNWNW